MPRHNLPPPPLSPTPLIGRAVELAAIAAELDGERLVTLAGSGGIGKTRLAAQVGAELVEGLPGGVWWADLAPVGDGSAFATTLLAATGLNEDGMRPALETLKDRLGRAPTLVIFDNCEHLVAHAAAVIEALRAACPHLTVLATSREPLGLAGEVTWRVPSLSLPPRDGPFDIETLGQYDAVRLFLDRARRARPAMRLSDGQAAAISEICHRLDGVALAIEMAAARCRQLSPERIVDDLAQRFRLLARGARTSLPRQQTLLASVEGVTICSAATNGSSSAGSACSPARSGWKRPRPSVPAPATSINGACSTCWADWSTRAWCSSRSTPTPRGGPTPKDPLPSADAFRHPSGSRTAPIVRKVPTREP